MRILLSLFAAILLSTEVYAMRVDSPPRRYDHTHPDLVVLEIRFSQVDNMCRGIFGRGKFERFGRVMACAAVGNGKSPCILILPKAGSGVSEAQQAALFRHERAHCNGWAGHHPAS